MIIANPIYDIVFKYLMEDREVARSLISQIINEDIVELDFAAKEHTTEHGDKRLTFYRLDFKAKVKTADNTYKNILIELQKARLVTDVERFRTYVGRQYCSADETPKPDGQLVRKGLPIITIYFLGHELSPELPASLKVSRQYVDLITGELISQRNDFIERLSHDMYVVQIPRLPAEHRNDLEELLCIFRQDHPGDKEGHTLVIDENKTHCELTRRILRILSKLTEKPKVRQQMDDEDELFRTLEAEIDEKTRELKAELLDSQIRKQEERRQKEEERRQKEDALSRLAKLQEMLDKKNGQ